MPTLTSTPPTADEPREPFPLLADPDGYVACEVDLTANERQRAYWLGLFRDHFRKLLKAATREAADRGEPEPVTAEKHATADSAFTAYLDAIEADPHREGRLTILTICWARENALRAADIPDPYRLAKHDENEAAIAALPDLLAELDGLTGADRQAAAIRGVFAGNIFDLGATKTADLFDGDRPDFRDTRGKLKPRPWLDDGLDALLDRLTGPPHRHAVLFVDNAGPDITLGMLPLARLLLQRGTRVTLTANTLPSLNDVTHDELGGLVQHVAGVDAVFADARRTGQLRLVPSGNDAPLIDLTRVSPELAAACRDDEPDLVVLEGMGRAVETNYNARLRCDTLKLAMIKDEGVASSIGGDLYDLVCRFEPANPPQ